MCVYINPKKKLFHPRVMSDKSRNDDDKKRGGNQITI